MPMATYPIEYLEAELSGYVRMQFNVYDDGTVSDVVYIKGDKRELFEASKKAIEATRFTKIPGDSAEKRVSKKMQCTVSFSIEERKD